MLVKKKMFIDHVKVFLSNIWSGFCENRKKIVFFSAVMVAFVIFNAITMERRVFREMNVSFSMADSYVLFSRMFYKSIYIIPLFLLMVMYILKDEFQIQSVLRSDWKLIWKWDCCKIILMSVYVSLLETFTIAGTGLVSGQEFINWSQKESVFWVETGKYLMEEECLLNVVVIFNATTIITCIFIGVAYLVIKEITKMDVAAFVICMGWYIIEYYMTDLILNKLCIQYEFWVYEESGRSELVFIVLLFLFVISRKLVQRREYL